MMPESETIKGERKARAAAIFKRLAGIKNPVVVEVGVLVGGLSNVLLRDHRTLDLTMVDSWAPADQLPDAYRATGDVHGNQTKAQADANYDMAKRVAAKYGKRASVLRAPSVIAAEEFGPGTFDMVFLDADHSYEAVKEDLKAWFPAIQKGGWIGGHDYGHTDPRFDFSGVKRAVDEFAAAKGLTVETDGDFTWFCRLP